MDGCESVSPSFLPAKMRILSGSALKVLAMVIMLIDHASAILLSGWAPAKQILFSAFGFDYSIYSIGRNIGRIAFPIFCFLLVEGFVHTHSRRKYCTNLFLFALLSEIPWNFMQNGTAWCPQKQNVYFTLLLGFLGMWALETFREQKLLGLLALVLLFYISTILHADYRYRGYILILILYSLRTSSAMQALLATCWMSYEWRVCYAFLPINMYNGKRGFIKGKAKYIFYFFYPVHITVLVIVRALLFHV